MQILPITQVSLKNGNQKVFKQSVFNKWLGFVICLAVGSSLFYLASEGGYRSERVNLPSFLLYWTSGFAGFTCLILLFYAKASMRPSNWLLRLKGQQLLIKFRSHLNDHFSDLDPVVVSLTTDEILWMRAYRETMSMPGTEGRAHGEQSETRTFLELKLGDSADADSLASALKTERARKPPKIGSTRTKHKHYPLSFDSEPGTLRLDWSGITPGISDTLKLLGKSIEIKPRQKVKVTSWKQLEGKELEKRILDLVLRGKTIKAVSMAKIKYGYNTGEARKFVDELVGENTS